MRTLAVVPRQVCLEGDLEVLDGVGCTIEALLLHKLWTFRGEHILGDGRQLGTYILVASGCLTATVALLYGFVDFSGVHKLLATALITVLGFFLKGRIVFARKHALTRIGVAA